MAITLRQAKLKARKLINNPDDIPNKDVTIRSWIMYGLISGNIGYKNKGRSGGRVGLYEDTLPAEIAAIAELKNKYKLKQIRGIRNSAFAMLEGVGVELDSGKIKDISKKKLQEVVWEALDEANEVGEALLLYEYTQILLVKWRCLLSLENPQPEAKAK